LLGFGGGLRDYERRRRIIANAPKPTAQSERAEGSGLGFGGGALLIAGLLAVITAAHFYSRMSKVLLFWLAFVLTRPFGATLGDLMTKTKEKGGFDLGTINSSIILASILISIIAYTSIRDRKPAKMSASEI